MKKGILSILVIAMSLMSSSVHAQTQAQAETPKDTTLLGLPGDNLDLYAVLDLFLKSKTIEEFEKSLNEQKTGINNLDLDLDKKVDFIKVVTQKKDDSYTFVLQVAVSKTETQDVAVILVDRDKNKKVTVQMVGDKELYGKDYVIEPKTSSTPAVTANPAYTGPEPAKTVVAAPAVVVETVPIVQYVYSPVYVPYVPPYYYGYYPPYFAAFTVMAVGIYRHNNFYYHGGGYGYHNTVVINHNHYNNYNNTRNTSNRVEHNNANGNYGNRNNASTRPANGASGSGRPSNNGPSASTRPANGASGANRPSNSPSASTRDAGRSSNYSSSGSGRSRSSSSNFSGGGRGGGGGGRGGGGRRR